jgi:hypothetical protein
MRYLTKGVYWAKAEKIEGFLCAEMANKTKVKMWHDCLVAKGRTRLEMTDEVENSASFRCAKCQFTYVLDKHLSLK